MHFEDTAAARKIMKETDPLKIHTLGKRIRKYVETSPSDAYMKQI